MTTRAFAAILAVAVAAAAVKGGTIDEADARAAAVAFVNRDEIGASVLAGRQVASVTARDALWVVRLSPSGYVVLSGDTAAEPVVAFSTNDYVEPTDDSPFGALLALANTNAVAAGTQTTIRRALYAMSSTAVAAALAPAQASRRAAQWATLLGKADETAQVRLPLLTAASGSASSQSRLVEPFLSTTWSQYQPYNDFAFIDPSQAAIDNSYRSRYPCGCVATAYAQVMKYWEWPARSDEVLTYDHQTTNRVEGANWRTLRFDGHAAFEWSRMADSYKWYTATPQHESLYDLRGDVAESNRFPIARLLLYADVLSAMNFATGGSGSHFHYAALRDKWYEYGRYADREYDYPDDAAFFEAIYSDLSDGIPVLVTVPGHAIVAHGWQVDENGTQFVYLNYGWNGQNDGWFNTTETDSITCEKGYLQEAFLQHVPVLTAQLDPLPVISETNVTIRWSVPEKRAGGLGCQLKVREYRDDYSTWTEDFEATTQLSTDTNIVYVGTTSHTDGKGLVIVSSGRLLDDRFVVLPAARILSDQSVLSYRARANWATNLYVGIQASFNGGDWKAIDSVPVGTGAEVVDWTTQTVDLRGHSGERIQLRVNAINTGLFYQGSESDPCGIQLDDFQITNVRGFNERTYETEPGVRHLQVLSLAPGAECSFAVTPIGEEGAVESAAVWTRIAAEDEAATALPEITGVTSISETSPAVQEGFYRECARGTNVFFVSCSENVTSLAARPSHLSLVPDEAVAVYPQGGGRFVVTVDGSGIPESMDRSRMILTLVATDAGCAAAYKDLSLRFSSATAAEAYEPPAEDKATSTTPIPVPHAWLVAKGLVSEGAADADFEAAAKADPDGDGQPTYAEYLCGTDPTNKDDVLKVFIEMADGDPVISWAPTNAAASYFVQGVTNLVGETWIDTNAVNRAGLRFFRVRVEPRAE